MNKDKNTYATWQKVTEITLSVLIGLTGISFIIGCAVLYFTGGSDPYSRERVGDFLLLYTALPSALTVIGAVAAYVLGRLAPSKGAALGGMLPEDRLALQRSRINLTACDSEFREALHKEARGRRVRIAVAIAVTALLSVLGLVYMTLVADYAGGADFSNLDVLEVLLAVLPTSALVLGGWWAVSLLNGRSVERELGLITGKLAEDKSLAIRPEKKTSSDSERWVNLARGGIFIVAAVFIAVGIANGGMADVLAKAVKICTECIGLG